MKTELVQFFSSNQVVALLSAVAILVITFILFAKRWIGFSMAFILLLFSLIAGILINNPQFFTNYDQFKQPSVEQIDQNLEFKKIILRALDDVKAELKVEQDHVVQLKNQVHTLSLELDAEKQKLANFIEKTQVVEPIVPIVPKTEIKTEKNSETDSETDSEPKIELSV